MHGDSSHESCYSLNYSFHVYRDSQGDNVIFCNNIHLLDTSFE
jgi:hypothetical protein